MCLHYIYMRTHRCNNFNMQGKSRFHFYLYFSYKCLKLLTFQWNKFNLRLSYEMYLFQVRQTSNGYHNLFEKMSLAKNLKKPKSYQ